MISVFSRALRWRGLAQGLGMTLAGMLLFFQVWVSGTMPAAATGVYNLPGLSAGEPTWVVDQADVLSRLTKGELTNRLAELAEQTGDEVRFVTIHRLDYGETAETFADKLFEKWFPTPEDQAHQVLLVLDNLTNNAAIRSGPAIQALLSDETADSITQETLLAPLRNGNKYNQALMDASDRLIAILTGQPDPGPPILEANIQTEGTFAKAEETDDRNATVVVVVLLLVATVVPMATYYIYQAMQ